MVFPETETNPADDDDDDDLLSLAIPLTRVYLKEMGIPFEERVVPLANNPYAKFARTETTCVFPFVFIESIPPPVRSTMYKHTLYHIPMATMECMAEHKELPVEYQSEWSDSYLNVFGAFPNKTRVIEYSSVSEFQAEGGEKPHTDPFQHLFVV